MVIRVGKKVNAQTLTQQGFEHVHSSNGVDTYQKNLAEALIEIEVAEDEIVDVDIAID